jgi:hypothetical protein
VDARTCSQHAAAKREPSEREAQEPEASCRKRPCRQSISPPPGDDDDKGKAEDEDGMPDDDDDDKGMPDHDGMPDHVLSLFSPTRIEKAFQEIEVLSSHKADYGGSGAQSQLLDQHAHRHAHEPAHGENEQPNAQKGVYSVVVRSQVRQTSARANVAGQSAADANTLGRVWRQQATARLTAAREGLAQV